MTPLTLSAVAAQQKDCIQGRAIVEMGYDSHTTTMQVRSGKSCARHLDFPEFDFKSLEIVERPRNGSIEHLGRGRWRYTARQGYVGPDSFKLRYIGEKVSWRTGVNMGPFTIGQRYSVTVFR